MLAKTARELLVPQGNWGNTRESDPWPHCKTRPINEQGVDLALTSLHHRLSFLDGLSYYNPPPLATLTRFRPSPADGSPGEEAELQINSRAELQI